MQDEINQQTVALMIRATKISAQILQQAIAKSFLDPRKINEKINSMTFETHGKQCLRSLMDQGAELSNIPISEDNIGDFERVAKKYEIDYSLKKDNSREDPCYLVFFKARDADVMTAAFREYCRDVLPEQEQAREKSSVLEKLEQKQAQARNLQKKKERPIAKYKENAL